MSNSMKWWSDDILYLKADCVCQFIVEIPLEAEHAQKHGGVLEEAAAQGHLWAPCQQDVWSGDSSGL